jgi:hypothetical protein
MVTRPVERDELDDLLDQFGDLHGGMEACEPLLAQSIVFHAVDYGLRLGFLPHRDFREALFGPRPPELLQTPLCASPRPIYVSGPRDRVDAIVRHLVAAVGAGNFDLFTGIPAIDDLEFDAEPENLGEEDEEAEADGDTDEGVIDVVEVRDP